MKLSHAQQWLITELREGGKLSRSVWSHRYTLVNRNGFGIAVRGVTVRALQNAGLIGEDLKLVEGDVTPS